MRKKKKMSLKKMKAQLMLKMMVHKEEEGARTRN